jgi:hypothetical protein
MHCFDSYITFGPITKHDKQARLIKIQAWHKPSEDAIPQNTNLTTIYLIKLNTMSIMVADTPFFQRAYIELTNIPIMAYIPPCELVQTSYYRNVSSVMQKIKL